MRAKLKLTLSLCLGTALVASSLRAATFTAGNLAVFSADSASANNSTFSILELNSSATNQSSPVQTININGTTLPNALRTSGSAGTTGFLSDSADGTLLVFSAHNTNLASGNINAVVPRGVGTLNNAGSFTLQTTYTGTSGQQTRGATTLDNAKWFIGDQAGVYTNSSAILTAGNFRTIKTFGGVVYVQQTSTGTIVVNSVSDSGAVTGLPGLAQDANSVDFYLISSGSNGSTYDVLYVLESTSASAGTIVKYSLVSGTWTANGTYTTTFGGVGLCASSSGGGAVLYVTTGNGSTAANSIIRLRDTAGYNTTLAITTGNNVTVYTAAAGTTMKGIAFAPTAICPAPSVSAPTASTGTNVCSGASVQFSANASGGTTPYSYQWKKNGSTIGGATSSNYTAMAGSGFVDADQISVAVGSACGGSAVTSPSITMTVNQAPSAPTASAASDIGTAGFDANWNSVGTATGYFLDVATDSGFSSLVSGFNNLDVNNVTSYSVGGLSAATTYYYRVRADNTCGISGNSGTITVTTASGCVAATAATPVASPGVTVCAGTTLTLTENPSAGTAPFNYVWKKGGSPITNGGTISGATTDTLAINGVAAGDAGNYTCDVTAQCGGATSTSPQLTVNVNAVPTITLGSNPGTCAGAGSANLTYSATTGSPNQYSVTWDSAAHTAGFVDVGFTSLPASPITLTVPNAVAATYNATITVRNSTTNCASSAYTFSVIINANPVITAHPVTVMTVAGTNAAFTVATSASSPAYQWQVNNGGGFANVTGGDGSTSGGGTTFTTVTTSTAMNGYQYRCLVTDGVTGCQTISKAATLTVPSAFTPGDLAVFSADFAASNNTTFSIIELNTNTPNQSAVQTIRINGTSGSASLRTSGSASSTGYLSDSDDGIYLAFTGHNSTNTSGNANNINSRGVGTFDANGQFVLATTYSGSGGNQTRSATTVDGANWLIGDQAGIFANNSSVLTNINARSVKSFGGVVYVLQASATVGVASVSTLSADGHTVTGLPGLPNDSAAVDFYMISSGSNGSTYDILYVLENAGATLGAIQKYSLVSGTWVDNSSYLTPFGGFGMCARRSGVGSAIYVTSGTGATATNSVVKMIEPAGYNADIGIADENNVTLFTSSAASTIKGIAFAPVAGVPCTPIITSDPTPQIVNATANASFTVVATGTGLSYRWQKDTVDVSNGGTISGATSSNLVLTGVSVADSESKWRCAVISSGGCTNLSGTTRLIVNSIAPVQPFAPTNLVLEVVGSGADDLSSDASLVRILELTPNGTIVQSLVMQNSATHPTTAPYNLMESGTAGSDGNLTRSADGRFIVLSGYNGATGQTALTAGNDLRTIGLLRYDGNTNTPFGLDIGDAVNFRSATSSDGTNFWVAGQNTTVGLYYFNATTGTTNQLSTFNSRTVKIFSNQLFACSGANSPGNGIFAVGSGLPTSGTPAWSLIITNGTHSHSPYNFEFNATTNVCYVTDDGPTTNYNGVLNGGGIQKYTNSTTAGWSLAYIITNGCTKGNGAYGLAVDWSGADPVLYATTATGSSNRVIRIVDNAGSLSAATTIYAPFSNNYYLRGIALAPVQPAGGPSCTPPTITGDPLPEVVTVGDTAGFAVAASGVSLTYQWQKNGADIGNGGSISGATTSNLTLTGVTTADSGSSWQCVVISSGACSNTSDGALLTVYTPYQAWQIQYFGSTNAANSAMNVDRFGTGQNNLFKFIAGLDPTNPASIFTLRITNVPGQPAQKNLIFKPIAPGRTYTLQARTNLVNGSYVALAGVSGAVTNGTTVTITDLSATGTNKFYNVSISYP